MNKIKDLIKKYFSSFTFFYRNIGNRIFIVIGLSLAVSVLDGFGLSMFLPLLQIVSGDKVIDASQLGSLSFLLDGAKMLGISLNLMSVLFFMIIFFLFKGAAFYWSKVYLILTQQKFIKNMRISLLKSLNRMNFKKFITSDAGRIQNTMSGEVEKVSSAFVSYFAAFQLGVMVFVYLGFAFLIDAQFAVLVGIGGIVTNFLYRVVYTRTKDASRKLTGSSNTYQGLIIQHVSNFKYLRATGMVDSYAKKLETKINEIEYSRKRIGMLSSIGSASREPMLIIVIALVIIIQIKVLGGDMGGILISLLFFFRALSSLVGMQQSWNSFLGVSGSLENMQSFKKDLESAYQKDGKIDFNRFTKDVTFDNVSFKYGETTILHNIDLSLSKNKSFAFVGESGSGKTTLVNLLVGLLEPSNGTLSLDGQNIKNINKKSYQKRVGYITQEAVIFNDTIYNNVSFFAEKTVENLARFKKAILQSAMVQFIDELPDKEETELGNNGINLSGGQKQRISIARELFKDIDILVMDEATSALDSETERIIQESIESLQGQYTLIIVAHRLSTIRNVDEVIYMHKGFIEQKGSFEDLMHKLPRFRKMVELQEL